MASRGSRNFRTALTGVGFGAKAARNPPVAGALCSVPHKRPAGVRFRTRRRRGASLKKRRKTDDFHGPLFWHADCFSPFANERLRRVRPSRTGRLSHPAPLGGDASEAPG